ncbi:MAG TPA: hydroxymethylbilane synthase [Methylovirgula sp.]|nr:hydroxymethylbilane synthase [Methylovirgula sp.]
MPSLHSSLGAGPRLRIGTRGSPLALAQAHELERRLAALHAVGHFEIVTIKTSGDLIQDRPLSEAGGKGLFTKELDIALERGEVDIAVHSAKDLPTLLPDTIEIIGYLPREDARDVFISAKAPDPRALPAGAVVGTASLRRAALLKRLRPDLAVTLLRGNVETRLAKLARGEVDATILALAGLNRLGLAHQATKVLDCQDFVPAVGQGAIAITARRGDAAVMDLLNPILDPATGVALRSERALLRVLDGSCRTPIGGHARLQGTTLALHAIVLRSDGAQFFETRLSGPQAEAEELGESAARELLARAPKGFLEG